MPRGYPGTCRPIVQMLSRVDPKLKARLTRLSRKTGQYESALVEAALRAYLDNADKEQALASLQRAAV